MRKCKANDDYFKHKPNAVGVLGASAVQKVVALFCILAHAAPADSVDEIVRICRVVVEVFGDQYLMAQNAEDTTRSLYMNKVRGFPGMLGCIGNDRIVQRLGKGK